MSEMKIPPIHPVRSGEKAQKGKKITKPENLPQSFAQTLKGSLAKMEAIDQRWTHEAKSSETQTPSQASLRKEMDHAHESYQQMMQERDKLRQLYQATQAKQEKHERD